MANLTRWSPFREMARLDPFRDVEEWFKDLRLRPWQDAADPQIRMDVSEDVDAYTVKADIPGVDKGDIDVSIDGNQVAITAEIKRESKEEKEGKLLRSERYYGSVYRAFALPGDVDQEKAEARYDNGVLMLRLPKKAGGSARKLSVS